jgi:formylglycine-generating enzyme
MSSRSERTSLVHPRLYHPRDPSGPTDFPPVWANAWGSDQYGLFAELHVANAVQRMRWIEPGEFLMGAAPGEPEGERSEQPQHRVGLRERFWLADTACTQAFWTSLSDVENPSRFSDQPTAPVENASWNDIQDFLRRMNRRLQVHELAIEVVLPSEAQWEYACRAGTTEPFHFGKRVSTEEANYDGNYPYFDGKKGEFREQTVPVKTFKPNAWGLFEMHGNVWEFCRDRMRTYSALAPGQVLYDPEGPGDASGRPAPRVLRGGSWYSSARDLRSAYRAGWHGGVGSRDGNIGFRFALKSLPCKGPEG